MKIMQVNWNIISLKKLVHIICIVASEIDLSKALLCRNMFMYRAFTIEVSTFRNVYFVITVRKYNDIYSHTV